jgi:hypothetical protein
MLTGLWCTYQSSEEEWVGFKSPFQNSSVRYGSTERMALSTSTKAHLGTNGGKGTCDDEDGIDIPEYTTYDHCISSH